jgi:hypothetical protein
MDWESLKASFPDKRSHSVPRFGPEGNRIEQILHETPSHCRGRRRLQSPISGGQNIRAAKVKMSYNLARFRQEANYGQ